MLSLCACPYQDICVALLDHLGPPEVRYLHMGRRVHCRQHRRHPTSHTFLPLSPNRSTQSDVIRSCYFTRSII